MSKKISVKLYAITAFFFIFLILAFIVFQTLVFQSYYEGKKMRELKAGFQHLHAEYLEKGLPTNAEETSNYLEEFENRNNAKIALANLSNTSIEIFMFSGKNLEKSLFKSFVSKDSTENEPVDRLIPRIAPGGFSDADILMSAASELLALTQSQNIKDTMKPSDAIITTTSVQASGAKSIITAVLLNKSEESSSYLLAVSSLQPVDEALSVIRDLYLFFSVFAVLLILLLAFVFSDMVSKPLIRLNATAVKMADLDFSAKCDEKRNDEIGSLAHNLNFLSKNLHRALNDLKSANNRLTEDIKKEKQLEKMRKEFVAGVSHELKTPISLIMGYAAGLKENLVDGADKDRYLDIICDETQKMGNLVNDMLDLSQLESGKLKLNMNEFFINELVDYILRKFNTLFTQKKLGLELHIPEENILVYADEFRIEQVINNFLNNAIRHTPKHGVIRINMQKIKSTVRVEIENEGSNIDEADLKNIWQKFYKAEKSRNREFGGTGLGLAIVSNILQLHGCDYGVSNTATGVSFYFELACL